MVSGIPQKAWIVRKYASSWSPTYKSVCVRCVRPSLLPNELVKIGSEPGGDSTRSAAADHSPIDFNDWNHFGSGAREKTFLARIEIVASER
jgi:hypothetical protein